MRIIGITPTMQEYTQAPQQLQNNEFLWIACIRDELENTLPDIQKILTDLGGRPLLNFHINDLLSTAQPPHYDYTSAYDVVIFRHLTVTQEQTCAHTLQTHEAPFSTPNISTQPIGFVTYDHILLTIFDNLNQCEQHTSKVLDNKTTSIGRIRHTMQHHLTSPDELMLYIIDTLLADTSGLKQHITTKLTNWQNALLTSHKPINNWNALFDIRNQLQQIEELYEDQSITIKSWMESLDEDLANKQNELIAVRARDVIEHINRSHAYIHRQQTALENTIQLHFSATSNRTNQIMRILTVVTCIFLPLNLITGLFGMNFNDMFLTQYSWGFWLVLLLMAINTIFLIIYFWHKNYLK